MIRLSIIIPFYNVEQYIAECLDSVFNQDIPLEEYEVICVDDCGQDDSLSIVESYASRHKNLRIVRNTENRKLGGARNAGLDVAVGKYVWYVDSDDMLCENVLSTFLQIAETNDLDILHFNYVRCNQTGIVISKVVKDDELIHTGTEFVLQQSNMPWYQRCPMAWNRLAKRDFYLGNNLRFVEKMMYEDTDFALCMYPLALKVQHSNLVGYLYRRNEKSITQINQTGMIMMYRVCQLLRCVKAYDMAPNIEYQQLVATFLRNELSLMRIFIKKLDLKEKFIYCINIHNQDISPLHKFCKWRTWQAIYYALTIFV